MLALCAISPALFGAQDASPAHMETKALVYVRDGAVPVANAGLKPADSDAPKPQGEGIHAGDQPGSIVYPILPDGNR